MALLTKFRSATLMEALMATVLIVVVFVIASLILNNVLQNTFVKNTHKISYRINELDYAIQNKQLVLPYDEEYEGWIISITRNDSERIITLSASNQEEKEISRRSIYAE